MCRVVRVAVNLGGVTAGFPAPGRCWEPLSALHETDGPGDIARVLGPAAWARLTADIRKRFGAAQAKAERTTYAGVMATVQASWTGRLLAQACRLIGTPLAPFCGRDIRTLVSVGPDPGGRGTQWMRVYHFPGRRPVTVRSSKVMDRDNRLLEVVGGGFGMRLKLYEEAQALHFLSTRYFWEGLGVRIWLPHWLTPGEAHVVHADVGEGRFRFTITMTHALLGELFFQDGVFEEEGDM